MRSSLQQATSKIVALARSGKIKHAHKLFDEMPSRDTVAWNAMLTSYTHMGMYQEAFTLFQHMRLCDIKPDQYTFTAMLSAAADAGDVKYGCRIHGLIVVIGYRSSLPVNNALIDMYGKCLRPWSAKSVFEEMGMWNEVSWCSLLFAFVSSGMLDVATEVFEGMPKRVDVSWNMMIAGYARAGDVEFCLNLFRVMRESECCVDQWTLSALMSACSKAEKSHYGCMVHAFVVKTGWNSSVEAQNSILSFYVEVGHEEYVCKALESIESSNQVSWNAIIDAHMKMGNTNEAYVLFQQVPEKNVVSWTSMIAGYARNGHERESISFFVDMMRHSVRPDELTFGAVLLACSNLAALRHGTTIHSCLIHLCLHHSTYVGNGLVNMYAKCGDLDSSTRAFSDITDKDIVSWNAILFAYGLHGWAKHALLVFEKMITNGITPDEVTFIGLLMACSHAGLLEKGQFLFKSMQLIHGISHEVHHVACMVDMFARSGYLTDAQSLANKYRKTISFEPLLGACSAMSDIEIGTRVGEELMSSNPKKDVNYVLLSNMYCTSGQWKEAELVRKTMADEGVRKMPGCSWIEVGNELTSFFSGDHFHPRIDYICKMLYFLQLEMRYPCFSSFEH